MVGPSQASTASFGKLSSHCRLVKYEVLSRNKERWGEGYFFIGESFSIEFEEPPSAGTYVLIYLIRKRLPSHVAANRFHLPRGDCRFR